MFNRRITLSILFIVLVVMVAYGTEYAAKNRGLNTATIIQMQSNNQTAAFLDIEVLRKLDASGPSLTVVLAAAGLDRFSTVEIKGLRSNTPYRLNKAEIDKDLNLLFTERGTVDLCHGEDKTAVLVADVSEINAFN